MLNEHSDRAGDPGPSQRGLADAQQIMSGLMSVTGVPDGQPGAGPNLAGYSVSDINAGFYAAIATCALRSRW